MNLTLPLAVFLAWPAGVALASTWSGSLVDAKCYASEEFNTNPTNTLKNVDSDRAQEIRACRPKQKTKSFTLVQVDGQSVNLDDAGNAKAADLVRTAGKPRYLYVTVTGEKTGQVIKVESIAQPPGH
jgi:hypothetical protein